MRQSWTEFLDGPSSGHGVQIYAELDELAQSVVAFVKAGFEAGEPAVVVATPDHLDAFRGRLAALGWNPRSLEDAGLLSVADADETLSSIMEDDVPSAARFEQVVGSLLDRAGERFPGRPARVFGEMVDLLCDRGRADAAIRLEEIWSAAARTRRFSLLCGYRLDVFDRESQADTLPWVCALHTHVLPARHYARFAHSVDRALDEVLGSTEASRLYVLVSTQVRGERAPLAQQIVMWLSANRPSLADSVLAAARTHYVAGPAPTTL
jgi:hypothetical protein